MECYICHRLIERREYTRHVGSHLAGGDTGTHHQSDPSLADFSYDTANYHHHGIVFPVHFTLHRLRASRLLEHEYPLHPLAPAGELWTEDVLDQLPAESRRSPNSSSPRTALVPDRSPRQGTQNPFQIWLKNPTRHSAKYTTIDGQKSGSDLQAQLRQDAEVLRRTTREEVIKIVKDFEGFSYSGSNKQSCLDLVQKVPIFPGLVAYTYTHLSLCAPRGWIFSRDDWSDRVSELKQLVESWTKSGDVQCILACNSMKNRLLGLLRATPGEHKCNSALLNGTMVLNHDIRNLTAVVALCITGPQKRDILDQRGSKVEELVDLFHDLLEANVQLSENYQTCFFNPLIRFSKETGYCPRGVYLKEGTITGLVSKSQGGFGFVYRGKVGSRLVAVKDLKRNGQSLPEYNKQVSKEATVWRHLRHPNCLPLYGVYRMPTEGPDISSALVSPWMDQGTLFEYLEQNPKANRTQLMLDVVRGLNYLHSMQPHVAHRDLKPDNILITSKERACLADFGLVSTFDADDRFHTAPSQIVMGGTYYFMAPEIFEAEGKEDKRRVNKRACDMYALGCTIYAAYTGKPPFYGMGPVQLRAHVISRRRPVFPNDKIPLDMWSFVENLWGPEPSERLTAEMALGWMETKADQEGVDSSLAPFEEEWKWKGPYDDKCLWSVSL